MNLVFCKGTCEHAIRNDLDFEKHVAYLPFNLIKQGYVSHFCDWPFSSIHHVYVKNDTILPTGGNGMSIKFLTVIKVNAPLGKVIPASTRLR